jgi:dethiobiotin synthetase
MKRRVEQINPYPFASDFSAPTADAPDTVHISTKELALLLSDAQASGAAIARNDSLAEQAERLAQTSSDLKKVLLGIVDLAAYLEKAAIDEADREDALERVRRLAAVVIEGQGDLFSS